MRFSYLYFREKRIYFQSIIKPPAHSPIDFLYDEFKQKYGEMF